MESYKWELNKGRKECKKWELGSGISFEVFIYDTRNGIIKKLIIFKVFTNYRVNRMNYALFPFYFYTYNFS